LEVNIDNENASAKEFKLVTSIVNADNIEVANITSTEKIEAKTSAKKMHNLALNQPKLWDTENPYLYKVVTKIYEKSKLIDNYETPLGFRYFNFDAEKVFIPFAEN
jgi:beta-galactosidase